MTATSFPTRLFAAREALQTARKHTAPLPVELQERLAEFDPAGWAKAQAAVAAIEATIPGLQAAYDELDAQACYKCLGSGIYGGASRYLRNGEKYCFDCGGKGTHS